MNFPLKPLVLAMLVATSQLAGAADAPSANAPSVNASETPFVQHAVPAAKSPTDWIIYDDRTYTPVADDVSRSLDSARKAFNVKDYAIAAAQMRAVADELKLQADRAGDQYKALERGDKALLASDMKAAHENMVRMNAIASKVSAVADSIDKGKLKSKVDLDKVIDKAARADMERRWLVSDVSTWFPVIDEPQRHFNDAVANYARKNYKAATVDIRKGTSYLRLEAARASGDAAKELRSSIAQLDKLAASVEKGPGKDGNSMAIVFARANHALALEHRSRAIESWVRNEYSAAGYELKAAARGLEGAAGWVGGKANEGVSATLDATEALGDKLAFGASWTADEVGQGFQALGNSINSLGHRIGGTRQAARFTLDSGA